MGEPAKARGLGPPRKTDLQQRQVAPVQAKDKTKEVVKPTASVNQSRKPCSKTLNQADSIAGDLLMGTEKSSPSWAEIVYGQNRIGKAEVHEGVNSKMQTPTEITSSPTSGNPTPIKIEMSYVQDEISYWEFVVVCYMVGSNPPLHVIDGFVRRIWKDLDIDIVRTVDSGVFIVRLKSMDDRDKAYVLNGVLFDNKRFITKPWKPEMLTDKNSLSTMPVWIQLPKLKMEYWGGKSLKKIAGLVMNFIKLDKATSQKTRLRFARVLVELNTNEEYLRKSTLSMLSIS